MTTLDAEVADVETAVRPAARLSDRAAIVYLRESGAVPICIVERDCVCKFTIKVDKNAAAIWWIAAADVRGVVNLARRIAGESPDAEQAIAALRRTAEKRATLTPHNIAMARAGDTANRLDAYVASLRRRGAMKEFTRAYKRKRMAATARGEGFMCPMATLNCGSVARSSRTCPAGATFRRRRFSPMCSAVEKANRRIQGGQLP